MLNIKLYSEKYFCKYYSEIHKILYKMFKNIYGKIQAEH